MEANEAIEMDGNEVAAAAVVNEPWTLQRVVERLEKAVEDGLKATEKSQVAEVTIPALKKNYLDSNEEAIAIFNESLKKPLKGMNFVPGAGRGLAVDKNFNFPRFRNGKEFAIDRRYVIFHNKSFSNFLPYSHHN